MPVDLRPVLSRYPHLHDDAGQRLPMAPADLATGDMRAVRVRSARAHSPSLTYIASLSQESRRAQVLLAPNI